MQNSLLEGDSKIVALNHWIHSRIIPMSRQNIDKILENIPMQELINQSMSLSLNDHYWIKPLKSKLKYKDVNFFENKFSEDLGEILFLNPPNKQEYNLLSPDTNTNGWLKKKWKIIDNDRVLVKGGSGEYKSEPYNEVFASYICNILNINHTEYYLHKGYCLCPNFVTKETEFISAYDILLYKNPFVLKKDYYTQFTKNCSTLNISNYQKRLAEMAIIDLLIRNEDRHYGNFGILRDAKSLKILGFAPLFDNGSSMYFNQETNKICNQHIETQKIPFTNSLEEQIELFNCREYCKDLNLKKLLDIKKEFFEIYKELPLERINKLYDMFLHNVKQLIDYMELKTDHLCLQYMI